MTISTLTDSPAVTITAPFSIRAAVLDDLLAGALIAAGKNSDHLPTLAAVLLEITPEGITAAATDRYRLFIGESTREQLGAADDLPAVSLLIPRDEVDNLRRFIKPQLGKNSAGLVSLSLNAGRLIAATLNGEINLLLSSGTFPPFRQLIPTEFTGADSISLNPKFLADLSKVPGINKDIPLKIKINTPNRPVLAQYAADSITWNLLLMPMRLNA
jgi:DNA polymerase III sliding clamp (beta) subunit (PCNA family)